MAELFDQDPDEGMSTVMQDLGASARRSNLTRCAQLGEALDAAEAGRLPPAGRLEAAAVAHQVVGSAGTFGYPQVSALAAALEAYLAGDGTGSAADADGTGLQQARRELAQMVDALGADPVGGHQLDG